MEQRAIHSSPHCVFTTGAGPKPTKGNTLMSHSYLPSGCALGRSQRHRHTTISDPSVPRLLAGVTRRGPKTNRATQLQPSPNAGLSVFEPSAAVGQATPSLHFTGSTAGKLIKAATLWTNSSPRQHGVAGQQQATAMALCQRWLHLQHRDQPSA